MLKYMSWHSYHLLIFLLLLLFYLFFFKNGADDVKRHRWFRSIDWDAVPQRRLKVPSEKYCIGHANEQLLFIWTILLKFFLLCVYVFLCVWVSEYLYPSIIILFFSFCTAKLIYLNVYSHFVCNALMNSQFKKACFVCWNQVVNITYSTLQFSFIGLCK